MTETDIIRTWAIADSCRVIKRHASSVGVDAQEIAHVSATSAPALMDELNEAAGVLENAYARIQRAKEALLDKAEKEPA